MCGAAILDVHHFICFVNKEQRGLTSNDIRSRWSVELLLLRTGAKIIWRKSDQLQLEVKEMIYPNCPSLALFLHRKTFSSHPFPQLVLGYSLKLGY